MGFELEVDCLDILLVRFWVMVEELKLVSEIGVWQRKEERNIRLSLSESQLE